MRPIDAFRELWGISLKITSFVGSFAGFDQELGVVICRYCVGTLDRKPSTGKAMNVPIKETGTARRGIKVARQP
jgi:hypothetical protein